MARVRLGLTISERTFLESHGVLETHVADMRHRADWACCGEDLRDVGCFFAWGFRECVSGHRLTNGRGRCIQCHPSTIAFVLRHARPGWLYIAVAEGGRLTKVGIAGDVAARLRQLNAHRLAGVREWRVVHSDWCRRPAALEAELMRRLAPQRRDVPYARKGGQVSREVFVCSAGEAITTLAEIYADRQDW